MIGSGLAGFALGRYHKDSVWQACAPATQDSTSARTTM